MPNGMTEEEFMLHFIRFKIKAFREDDTKNVVRNVHKNVHKNVTKNDINNRREDIVNLIKTDNTVSLTAIAKAIGVTMKTIQRELAEMRHIVQHVGPTRGGHWEFL